MVSIDDSQFGFDPGRGTTDAIFVVGQLQEKYLAVNKRLYMAFVDLEKAFDRVPQMSRECTLMPEAGYMLARISAESLR